MRAVAPAPGIEAPGSAFSPLAPSPAQLGGSPPRWLYAGRDPARAITIEDLRAMAHRFLPDFALGYLEGGAEQEQTLARNLAALAAWRFLPRALVDVSHRSVSSTLFGRPVPIPVVIAPTGLNGLFRAGADRMLAEASAAAGIPFTQSTMSNMAMEQVRAGLDDLRHWWQLYVFGPPEVQEALVARAEHAGCEALVVTTDAQIFGDRSWSSHHFVSPGRLTWRSLGGAALHPRWLAATMLRRPGMPAFENIIEFVPKEHQGFYDSAFWVRDRMDKALDWETMRRIRALWPRRLLVKGLVRPEDVARAAEIGADGVVMSDHGGRQLDSAVAPLEMLPEARRLVGKGFTILVDGGIRRGADVLKAIALGADAVQIGRAALYGVAAAGAAGVTRAIAILTEEMDHTLGLMGATSLAELSPDMLAR
ncbi:alpha-hydroxy acid oxidase [Falsiroseomonas sp. HW251]|uniref:alpha-hydroxy acid oxidase n=1 Tax=Falsiroseomonas sp. HW251 TaxID=3390998 RepID=UPI003D31AE7E